MVVVRLVDDDDDNDGGGDDGGIVSLGTDALVTTVEKMLHNKMMRESSRRHSGWDDRPVR